MLICGTGSFEHVDDNPCPASMPKASKKKERCSKNPYSTRGLDKFSMVRAELEARRERIISKMGSQGVAMVQFMYHNSQDWVPIIIRPREPKPAADVKQLLPLTSSEIKQEPEVVKKSKVIVKKSKKDRKVKKNCSSWDAYYWPLLMVLILVCLVLSGRASAICWTTIWWYTVPIMKGWGSGNARRRKEYVRRVSDHKGLGGNLVAGPSSSSSQAKKMQELASPRTLLVNGKRG